MEFIYYSLFLIFVSSISSLYFFYLNIVFLFSILIFIESAILSDFSLFIFNIITKYTYIAHKARYQRLFFCTLSAVDLVLFRNGSFLLPIKCALKLKHYTKQSNRNAKIEVFCSLEIKKIINNFDFFKTRT